MAYYGYTRTSTKEQHLDRGINEIKEFGIREKIDIVEIYTDKQTGKNFDRPEYSFIKKRMLPGDCLIVPELDRFGRTKATILKEIREISDRGIRVIILEVPTTTINVESMPESLAKLMLSTINNLLIEMLSWLAESEMKKREKRQREGIQAKKLRGEWDDYGRPKAVSLEAFSVQYNRVLKGEIRPKDCQLMLNISSPTYYRYIDRLKEVYNEKERD